MELIDIGQWIVLVVDDQDECREIAADALTFHGIRTYQARNGDEALRLMERITPTCVLTELSMPTLDGWMLRKGMQHFEQLADIPVIALTAPKLTVDRDQVMRAGFAGFLAKPFNTRTLVIDIAAILLPEMWKAQEMA